jgi:flavin-binding protein dodecin
VADHTYAYVEFIGTSGESIESAIGNAVAHAKATVDGMDWFEVQGVRGMIDDDRVGYYQVTVKIGHRV